VKTGEKKMRELGKKKWVKKYTDEDHLRAKVVFESDQVRQLAAVGPGQHGPGLVHDFGQTLEDAVDGAGDAAGAVAGGVEHRLDAVDDQRVQRVVREARPLLADLDFFGSDAAAAGDDGHDGGHENDAGVGPRRHPLAIRQRLDFNDALEHAGT